MVNGESGAPNLYAEGWRQGSIFRLELTTQAHVLGEDGVPIVQDASRDTWVLTSQDCDLASALADNNDPLIEVRPVHADDTGDWGIRSRKLRLDGARCLLADGIPARVSPAVLSTVAHATREPPLEAGRAIALKTWLGLRFDRPAVPDHVVPLAQDIAKRLRRPSGRGVAGTVHDVLLQFDDSTSPPRVALFAVVEPDVDADAVRRWLADAANSVPTALGLVFAIDVGTKDETSLHLIESSYAADVTQITWRSPDPEGAT
jgi:hypothetical protein